MRLRQSTRSFFALMHLHMIKHAVGNEITITNTAKFKRDVLGRDAVGSIPTGKGLFELYKKAQKNMLTDLVSIENIEVKQANIVDGTSLSYVITLGAFDETEIPTVDTLEAHKVTTVMPDYERPVMALKQAIKELTDMGYTVSPVEITQSIKVLQL